MANVKRPFMRSYSLGGVFKRKRTPYQPWEEDALLDVDTAPGGPDESPVRHEGGESRRVASPGPSRGEAAHDAVDEEVEETDADDSVWRTEEETRSPTAIPPGSTHLVDCLYLGACDMTGHAIRGRGCIDEPAGRIWEHTQEKRRKNSLPSSFRLGSGGSHDPYPNLESLTFGRKFVRLFAGKDSLLVFDESTSELTGEFSYRRISFVGTHPKHSRLFAFIAEGKGRRTPFLHAFKCEDKTSASDTANKLSTVFEKKIAELLAESDRLQADVKQQTIEVDVHATIVD